MKEQQTVPLVYMSDFNKQLDLAMKGDIKAIKFIDSLTIDRVDGMGFDMYSKTSFWADRISRSSSICAMVGSTYAKYNAFRGMQERNEIPRSASYNYN